MPENDPTVAQAEELRQRAEAKLKAEAGQHDAQESVQPWGFRWPLPGTTSRKSAEHQDDQETAQQLHELRVHQVELEMQNEELRRTQQELEAARARYFDLYDLAPIGYCTIDKQGLILEANLTAASQLGLDRRALVKQPLTRFILPEDQDVYARLSGQLFVTGPPQVCELRLRRANSTPFWARLAGNLAHAADNTPLCRIVISDITVHKQMEEALLQSEAKYRTVADFTHDWEFWRGPGGDFLYCSPSCARITGQPATAFVNDPGLLRDLVHPDDLAVFDQHCLQAEDQQLGQELEFRIIRTDEAAGVRWLSQVCQPVYDAQGGFCGTRGSNRDITERKRMAAEVTKARNLESLGLLTGGIAHDFNNLFQGLFGNLELARMYTAATSKAMPFLEKSQQVQDMAIKLTGQLVSFSTGGIQRPMDIQPASLIQEEVAAILADSGLTAEFALADDLWHIHVDPDQLRQVIKHLVRNAMEAMPDEAAGKIKIMAGNETLAKGHSLHPALAPGQYVRIAIKDQGLGISRENLPRIFDPYFSTKERCSQKGMGLGLALCETIIRKQGGAITVKSQPGKGSTFHVFLPAMVAAAQKTAAIITRKARGARILLMDDDLSVVKMLTQFLQISGFRVDSTLDGNAAITAYEQARSAGDPYIMVILDLSIPGGRGGKEVITTLKQIDPAVKAIVSSGYASDPVMTDFADYGFVAACVKPYLLSELKETMARFL